VRKWLTIAVGILLLPLSSATSKAISASSPIGSAQSCPGAIAVTDPKRDTRSWVIPPRLPELDPSYGDLRRFEVKATAAGVCVRWTTAAPAPRGAHFVFSAGGPYVRDAGGGAEVPSYGFDLELRKDGALATYGLDRVGSYAPRVVHVRAGQTGSVVSAFVSTAELNRPPANMPTRPHFPYRAFVFEARVLTAPDARRNQRVDFWPQEARIQKLAADINGRLCFPCQDKRFIP
jgi:hypothetical protein